MTHPSRYLLDSVVVAAFQRCNRWIEFEALARRVELVLCEEVFDELVNPPSVHTPIRPVHALIRARARAIRVFRALTHRLHTSSRALRSAHSPCTFRAP